MRPGLALGNICVLLFIKSRWFIYPWVIAGVYLIRRDDLISSIFGVVMVFFVMGFYKGIIDMRASP